MSVKPIRAALAAAFAVFAVAGPAQADPLLSAFVLAPLDAAEKAELQRQEPVQVGIDFDAPLFAAGGLDDVDIDAAPLRAYSEEWRDAPTPPNSIAARRQMFEEQDQPQFLLTRFSR